MSITIAQLFEQARICEKNGDGINAAHIRAVALARSGNVVEALGWFQKALEAAPARADIVLNYANALCEAGEARAAIAQCKIILDANPSDSTPFLYNILGNAWMILENYSKVILCIEKALALQPDYSPAWENLGQAFKKQGNIERAFHAFSRIHAPRLQMEVSPQWIVPIEGNNIVLRPQNIHDAEFLQLCFSDLEFTTRYNRNLFRISTVSALKIDLEKSTNKHPCETNTISWVIENKTNNPPIAIGLASLTDISFLHQRAEFLVGIPDFCKKQAPMGAGLEASLLAIDFAFNRVNLNKITSIVYGDNSVSQNNTIELGFELEGIQKFQLWDKRNDCYRDIYNNGLRVESMRSNSRLARLSKRLLGRDITKLNSNIY